MLPTQRVERSSAPGSRAGGSDAAAGDAKPDGLSTSKVAAGGMAAATSAVFGSYLGAFGTVGGAAVGAVATTVITHMYQQSIDNTRQRVRSKIRTGPGQATAQYVGTAQPARRGGTTRAGAGGRTPSRAPEMAGAARAGPAVPVMGAAPADGAGRPRGRRSITVLVAGTVAVFLLGLALVTGIEWAKGSSLSGGTGSTSVQGVLHPQSVPAATTPEPTTEPDESPAGESSDPSDESGDSDRSSDSGRPSGSERPSDSVRPSDSERPSDSVPPTDADEPEDPDQSGESGDQRCRATLPPLLCGQSGPGSR